VLKQKDSFSITQLSKILLAYSMNNREIPDSVWKDLLEVVLSKIDKADSKDTFYICTSLGKGKIKP